jgi:hypothetical protein
MPEFDEEGQPTKTIFRVYCGQENCKTYIMGRWGGGYGCIKTKRGNFDARNQVWVCKKHEKSYNKNLKKIKG